MTIHLYHLFYAVLIVCAVSAIYSVIRMIIQPGWKP